MKNLSLLSLATLMLGLSSGCVLTITDDTATDEASTDATATDSATESGTSNGDGDGDTTTATTDTGTTDPTTDTGTTDPTTDTSTETTGTPAMCGWDATNGYYDCGFEGTDPGGSPIECPQGLVEGDPCETTGLTGVGCCDADGNNWYCSDASTVVLIAC